MLVCGQSFASDRFHVKSSLEEWLNTAYDSLETVVVDEADLPHFEFNVKVRQQPQQRPKRRDVYIPCCAVARLKQLQERARARKIAYSAPSLIRFAFNHGDAQHRLHEHQAPAHKRQTAPAYREPCDEHVARLVADGFYRADDTLGELSDQDVVYYYLSVLRSVDCAPLNRALAEARARCAGLVYQSAVLPGRLAAAAAGAPKYYTTYAETVHFLGLMAPPTHVGDHHSDVVEKVRRRNAQQTRQLCQAVGIDEYAVAERGREWLKLVKFFEAQPQWCAAVGATLVEAADDEAPALTVIECQMLAQVRQLWRWRNAHDLYNCYAFATSAAPTAAHRMPAIAEQCERVRRQYSQLLTLVKGGDAALVPYVSFYAPDEKQLQALTDVRGCPELLYAAVSSSVRTKRANAAWHRFVATRPASVPRDLIERLLATQPPQEASASANDDDDDDDDATATATATAAATATATAAADDEQQAEDGRYLYTDASHFDTEIMDDVRTERTTGAAHDPLPGLGLADVEWDAVLAANCSSSSGGVTADQQPHMQRPLCDEVTAEGAFFDLRSHFDDQEEGDGDGDELADK